MLDGQTRTGVGVEDDGCTQRAGLERTRRMWKWTKEWPGGGMGKGRGRWAAWHLEGQDGCVAALLRVCQMVWGEHRW